MFFYSSYFTFFVDKIFLINCIFVFIFRHFTSNQKINIILCVIDSPTPSSISTVWLNRIDFNKAFVN